jgi:RNA polymerase sigma factor (sigma-70 family)
VDISDGELLRAYVRDGDESALAHLVKRHAHWIFQAARRRLGDEHPADDAAQAVFLVLARKAAQPVAADRSSLSAWLFPVMHFTCGRLRQRRSRQAELERSSSALPSSGAPDRDTRDGELLALIEDSVAQLPPAEREMVVRRFNPDMAAGPDRLSIEPTMANLGQSNGQFPRAMEMGDCGHAGTANEVCFLARFESVTVPTLS